MADFGERVLRWRRRTVGRTVDGGFGAMSRLGALFPAADPARHGVERIVDVAYLDGGGPDRTLDVYRPIQRTAPLPVVLYLHGGAFQALSKDTHWLMGLAFARRGYVVFNANYRRAPLHRFPAGLADACSAYAWVVAHASEWGGDAGRLVLAGESAGANLVTSLAIAASWRRPEPWAAPPWDAGIAPVAVVAACGMFQVSDAARFVRERAMPFVFADRILDVEDCYFPLDGVDGTDMADPLLLLERGALASPPERPLPPFFLPVGTRDPLMDDTRRMAAALDRLGVPCDARYYEGEMHAFHALVFREPARRCWQETFEFLARHGVAVPQAESIR